MAINVFDLYAKLGLDSSGYDKGLKDAGEKGSNFGSKLTSVMKGAAVAAGAVVTAIGATSAAFVKATGDAAAYGDNIDKMSQKMGLTAEAYQEWDAVMQHSGTSIESLQVSMKTLASAAETGNKAFQALGISQQELATLSQQELFERTIASLQSLEDQTQRTYLAGQLLGRGATELGALLNTSAEDTQAMRDRVHELGGVMSDEAVKSAAKYQDTLQDMSTAFSSVKRNMISEFMPSVTTVMEGLTELFAGDGDKGISVINEGIDQFSDKLTTILPNALETGTRIVTALGDAITKNTPALIDIGTNAILSLTQGAVEKMPEVAKTGVTAITTLASGIKDSIPVLVPAAVSSVSEIARTLTEPETLKEILDAGLDIVVTLAESIGDNIPEITDTVFTIAGSVLDVITSPEFGSEIITAGGEIVVALAGGIITAVPTAIGAIVDVMTGVTDRANDPEWQERSETAGAAIVESMSTAFLNNSETFLESVENTLWRVDNLLGTHFEQWYKDFEDFSFDLGKWVWDASAEASGLNDAISEADKQFRVAEMKNAITREFNEAVRAGQDISDAFDTAREAVIKTTSDTNLYYDELYDYFTPDFLQQQAAAVNEAVAANEAAAQAQRDAFEATVAKGKEYERYYTQQVRTINVLNEEQLQGAKAQSEALIDEVQELSEKELAAQQKAAEKALAEQQKAAEKALKEQQKAEEKAQKDRERAAEKAQKAQEKAEQAQTKALEKAISEREKLLTKYQSDIEKIYDNIDSLEKDYADDVKSRTQDIFNSYSLFEEVPDRIQVSGADLTKNLEQQVERMKLFYSELDQLAAKGVDESLVENIRSQGVGALDNLDALLDLSDAEIENYNKLYQQKAEFASQQADKELESAKQTTIAAVADEYDKIDKLTAERSKTIGETFINGIAEGMKNGFGSLTEAATNAIFGGYASQSLINYADTETGRAEIRRNKVSDTADTLLGAGGIVINVNGIQYQNPSELAAAMSVEIQKQIRREGKAYA